MCSAFKQQNTFNKANCGKGLIVGGGGERSEDAGRVGVVLAQESCRGVHCWCAYLITQIRKLNVFNSDRLVFVAQQFQTLNKFSWVETYGGVMWLIPGFDTFTRARLKYDPLHKQARNQTNKRRSALYRLKCSRESIVCRSVFLTWHWRNCRVLGGLWRDVFSSLNKTYCFTVFFQFERGIVQILFQMYLWENGVLVCFGLISNIFGNHLWVRLIYEFNLQLITSKIDPTVNLLDFQHFC